VHVHTVATLPWEVQKAIFQQCSTIIETKQIIFQSLPHYSSFYYWTMAP